eukprot:scaffold1509_cov240-Pinguiococcus_pyrenoidosus.AAC.25
MGLRSLREFGDADTDGGRANSWQLSARVMQLIDQRSPPDESPCCTLLGRSRGRLFEGSVRMRTSACPSMLAILRAKEHSANYTLKVWNGPFCFTWRRSASLEASYRSVWHEASDASRGL